MIDKKEIEAIVKEWLADKSYFLTDLTVSEDNHIVVEIDEKDGVWIEDCVSLSKFVEDHLNRDKEDFELEVGSAGIGRPFKVLQQYINHLGDEVEVLCTGRQKYKGILKNADEQGIVLTVKQRVKPEGAKRATLVDADIAFTFEELESVCYVINFK